MAGKKKSRPATVRLQLVDGFGGAVDPAGEITLQFRLVASKGLDLAAAMVRVAGSTEHTEHPLTAVEATADAPPRGKRLYQTEQLYLRVPHSPGQYEWRASVVPAAGAPDSAELAHLTVPVTVNPHETRVVVWGVPSPAVANQPFQVIVGVKSLAGYPAADQTVEITDHTGALCGSFTVGQTVYSDQVDLYHCTAKLSAPAQPGTYLWSARLTDPTIVPAHRGDAVTFDLIVSEPADGRVTFRVFEKETQKPVARAHIVMRPYLYRAETNEQGLATLSVVRGSYAVSIIVDEIAPVGIPYRIGEVPRVTRGFEHRIYIPAENLESLEFYHQQIEVAADTLVEVELVATIEPPEEDTL